MRRISLVVLVMAFQAQADTGLAIVCVDASAEGTTVGSRECENAAQKYNHPQAGDLVRYDSVAVIGSQADWSRPSFVWKRWDEIEAGDPYEVCTTDVPPGTWLREASCTAWGFVAKENTLGTFTLSWRHPLAFDNGAPLAVEDLRETLVEWGDGVTFADGSRSVKAPADSVAMPNPAPGMSRCYRVLTVALAPDGVERSSDYSEPWCKVVPEVEVRPLAPTNLQGN